MTINIKQTKNNNNDSWAKSRWTDRIKVISFSLAFIIFATGVSIACYGLLFREIEVDNKTTDNLQFDFSSEGRMLIILLDSIPSDNTFSDQMQFISGSRNRGAWGTSEVVSVPITVVGQRAIFSGEISNPLAFFEDFKPSTSDSANLFKRVLEDGKRSVIFGKVLRDLYGEYTDLTAFKPKYFSFAQYKEEATYIFGEAYEFLKNESWDVAVITFDAADHVGHLETLYSDNYQATLQLLDNFVKQLVWLTTEDDTVLITSEHGMDVSGFHTERSPIVIDTPFVLWGPKVRKVDNERILQIDLASTLSVLAGVSPFYNSPAIPVLDLLKLSEKDKKILLKESSLFITGNSNTLSLDELYERREINMSGNGSVFVLVIITLTTFLSLLLLACFLYVSLNPAKMTQYLLARVGIGVSVLFLLVVLLKYLSVYDLVSHKFPFSANFIIAYPFSITSFFVITVVISFLLRSKLKKMQAGMRELTGLVLFVFISSGILIAENPYHLFNWLILLVPLIAWGINGSKSWIVIFAGLLSGLLIRRVTFLNAYFQISIPGRWVIVALFLFVVLIYLWFKNRNSYNNYQIIIKTVLCFIPGLIFIIYPFDVETRAILLLLIFIPVFIVSRKEVETGNVLMAIWVVFFYLGTSDSVNHLSHIAVFPILVAVWSVSKKFSTVTMGITVSILVWAFYFFPGNSFDLNLLDIKDNYILGSATNVYIKKTVFVIACRFILPAAILVWTVRTSNKSCNPFFLASIMFVPLFFGIGSRLAMLSAPATGEFPWVEYVRLIVIFGYTFILIGAFSISTLFLRISNRQLIQLEK